jgi:hypothetical protein
MRGHQVAAVAVARKLAVLCWDLLTKESAYLWARPARWAIKKLSMQLQAGQPGGLCLQRQGTREQLVATQAERVYEHFVGQWNCGMVEFSDSEHAELPVQLGWGRAVDGVR